MDFTKEQQEHVDNLVGLARKEGQDKILKDLGIENVESFKTSQKQKDEEFKTYKTKSESVDSLTKEVSALKLRESKVNKLLEKGLSIDGVALISGTTDEEIDKQIELLGSFIPKASENKGNPNPNENNPKGGSENFASKLNWEEK